MNEEELSPTGRELADRLGRLATDPTPAARARVLAAVRAAPRIAPVSRPWWRPGRRAALAGALATALLGGSGAAAMVASAHALPGGPAYTLRVAGEKLRLATAGGEEKERLRIAFSRERLDEADAARRRGDRDAAADLTRDSRGYLNEAEGEHHQEDNGRPHPDSGELRQVEQHQRAADAAAEPPGHSPGSSPGGIRTGGGGNPQQPHVPSATPSPDPGGHGGGDSGGRDGGHVAPPPASSPSSSGGGDSTSPGGGHELP